MTLVVGLSRDERAGSALEVAAVLARSGADALVACTVIPAPWPAGAAKIDAEYQEYLDRLARGTLDAARAALPADVAADFEVARARSTPSGLLRTAEQRAASLLVLGSSSAGAIGRVSLGSVADRVLHSSPVPVALAPRGFRAGPGRRVTRVTVAYSATEGADELVRAAVGVATRFGAGLRLASFAVRPRTMLTAGIGSRAEAEVASEWSRDVALAQQRAVRQLAALPAPPRSTDATIGHGQQWPEAIEDIGWAEGDVLLVGSSTAGPLARVFLGSRASKIVRNSPVPVVLVPRPG